MKSKILNVSLNRKVENLSYPIIIGDNILSSSGEILKEFIYKKNVIIIYDSFFSVKTSPNNEFEEFVQSINKLTTTLNFIDIPGGDQTKNINQLNEIIEKVLTYGIDRQNVIIAFGGGVIGDIAGFAASILLRGINYIQVPTTLLSQVDSSVGGKTGINSKIGKNLIGSFHQPQAVLADINILKTLPNREFRAGFAEVVKYGLIKDLEFFNWLNQEYDSIFIYDKIKLQKMITKSCEIKAKIIKNDEKEGGKRALLNLGHTFAHAIESFGNFDGRIIHGEAVSIGICLAFKLSNKLCFCSTDDTKKVINLFQKSKLPTSLHDIKKLSISTSGMIQKFKLDKKNRQNELTFILNKRIGESFIKHNVSVNVLTQFLNEEI
jgi:3-dehydroquinate synthase|tara:strand:- start:1625 stop:2758 length:1134 start_codon:yes stop_codon:yes gene_type:complete